MKVKVTITDPKTGVVTTRWHELSKEAIERLHKAGATLTPETINAIYKN